MSHHELRRHARATTRRYVVAALVASLWLAAPVSAQVSIVTTGPADTPAQAVGTAPAPLKEPGNGWNVWANKASTTTLFLAMAADLAGFIQDDVNTNQVGNQPTLVKWRAERINLVGRLNFTTPWVWQFGVNFNGLDAERADRWTVMDARLDIPVPRVGRVRIGRQKQGFGQEWELPLSDWAFMERASSSNAFGTTRNVGVIVTNTFARQRGMWSAGWFNDWFAKDNSFSGNGNQYTARLTLLPVDTGEKGGTLVEVGSAVRYKESTNGKLQYRALPEINQSDFFVDTAKFDGDHSTTVQFETMAIKGPWEAFGEWSMTPVSSAQNRDPFFFGGFAGVAYLITGEHRGFNRPGGFETRVTPASPFSFRDGGRGAWEVAGRYSYVDLTDGAVDGGVMSRWTAALSWHATREWRADLNYGYITLDKAAQRGHAHGISCRILWYL
jgi:phosphate-selective porin OprO/OprP